MWISELDEWQGLTEDMLHEWMQAHDCRQHRDQFGRLAGAVVALSQIFGKTPQALLREINPRMRKGWPSDEALAAHPNWMIKLFDDDAFVVVWPVAHIMERKERAPNAEIGCWPTDSHGNKVRWPTDAEGKML